MTDPIDPAAGDRSPGGPESMTLEEAATLVTGADFWHTAALERLAVPASYLNDGSHGVRATKSDAIIVTDNERSTCFPTQSALGATWDPEAFAAVARAVGVEARAHCVAIVLGPGVNLQRTPLGGRNFEYFSEDPHLTSSLAIAYVDALQATGTGACLKHFVGNDQEIDRMSIDVVVDARAFREVYLEPFANCIAAAAPAAVMVSYNRLNGRPVIESAALLGDVLRNDLGFTGVAISDWGAVADSVAAHRAGLDLEMPGPRPASVRRLLDEAERDPAFAGELRRQAARVVEMAARCAVSDERSAIDFEAHHRIARRAAADAIVLMQNDGVLPLGGETRRVLVVGDLARHPRIQGRGSSLVEPERVSTPLAALRAALPDADVEFVELPGDPSSVLVDDGREVDAIVAFVGLPDDHETEGRDRPGLDLPSATIQLLERLAEHAGPVVVVTLTGGPVTIPRHSSFAAILHGGLLGGAVGEAVADVLTGTAEPGGRLAQTWPAVGSDLLPAQRSKTTESSLWYTESVLVGHRRFDEDGADVLFPFGHGLSYTTFEHGPLRLRDLRPESGGDLVDVEVGVTNVGDRSGKCVTQLYLRAESRQQRLAHPRLRRHHVARLAPGETATVRWRLTRRDVQFFDDRAMRFVLDAGVHRLSVATSSRAVVATATFRVELDRDDERSLAATLGLESPGRDFVRLDVARQLYHEAFEHLDEELSAILLDMPLGLAQRLFPDVVEPVRVERLLDRLLERLDSVSSTGRTTA